jgi:hypothetical protein
VNGKDCPNCKMDIGLLAIVKAGLPNLIKCPNCKKRLKYKPFPLLLSGVCIIVYLSIILLLTPLILSKINIVFTCVVAFLLWQPFEYFIAKHLRAKYQLRLK